MSDECAFDARDGKSERGRCNQNRARKHERVPTRQERSRYRPGGKRRRRDPRRSLAATFWNACCEPALKNLMNSASSCFMFSAACLAFEAT
jgi:hypothetical protein